MRHLLHVIGYDYLQRIRSYRFLVILAVCLGFGFLLVPGPDANYETLTIGRYVGFYNSAWIGTVSATMASTFIGLLGYYVINTGIKKDIDSQVGQVIATTQIRNTTYLMAKALSNFFVLSSMLLLMLFMNVGIFFLYNTGYAFEWVQFAMPYLLIPLPTLFIISAVAVIMEVLFIKRTTLQSFAYFIFFAFIMVNTIQTKESRLMDPIGTHLATNAMIEEVNEITGATQEPFVSIGFRFGDIVRNTQSFEFTGIQPTLVDVLKRLLWFPISLLLVALAAPRFHRFDIRASESTRKKKRKAFITPTGRIDLKLKALPEIKTDFSFAPLLKVELLMLLRQGPKWLWLVNLAGVGLLTFLPLDTAHSYVLPILWFLQIGRWSELSTKEKAHQMDTLIGSSFRPLRRVYSAQLVAGVSLALLLALPLMLRYLIGGNLIAPALVIFGAAFLVGLAALAGLISGGKKLFEILFFFIGYANLYKIPALDYFGAVQSNNDFAWLFPVLALTMLLLSYLIKQRSLRRN